LNKIIATLILVSDAPVAAMFVSPSVSPFKGYLEHAVSHNPAIRKYIFDRYEFTLEDYEQFYLDLDLANKQNNTAWQLLYTFTKTYGVHSVSPYNLEIVAQSFSEFASEMFHKYYERKFVNERHGYVPCNCECKNEEICMIRNMNLTEYEECVEDSNCSGINASDHNVPSVCPLLLLAILSVLKY
jgi:sphingomyelin phosphodiesterase acid-like 3